MLTNLPGRVESDPMAVPKAASMAMGRDNSFENVLQQVVDADETRVVDAEPIPSTDNAIAAESAPVEDQAPEQQPQTADRANDDSTHAGTADPLATSHAAGPDAEVTETTRRGEPERQATAGKGADSPRPSSPTVEPLLATALQYTVAARVATTAEPANGVSAIGGARTAGEAPTRGIDGPMARPGTPSRAPAVAAGYRTNSAASAKLLEQTRDSIFKQIMMKLTGDGGEMRMRLDPPELGELDLHLVVEGGNKLSLSIAAERQDLAHLLQRHLDELKQTLENAGLEVSSAQVQTRSEFARDRQNERTAPEHLAETNTHTDELPRTARRGGYVTAEGLDFWA